MPLAALSRQRFLTCIFAVLLVALLLFSVFGERGAIHLWRLQAEKKRLDEKNFVLQRDNEALRDRIYRLRHDDSYLEKVAREELGLARPGEIIYRFGSPESKAKRAKALSERPSQPPQSSEQKSRP